MHCLLPADFLLAHKKQSSEVNRKTEEKGVLFTQSTVSVYRFDGKRKCVATEIENYKSQHKMCDTIACAILT